MASGITNISKTQLAELYARIGCIAGSGLRDEEIEVAEHFCGARFPPDLRALLQTAMPLGTGFPNWRVLSDELRDAIEWPYDGILFDVRNEVFWHPSWGGRPVDRVEAVEIARVKIAEVPRMIPVFRHVCIPAVPSENCNPLFSIHQADVIHCGANIMDYLEHLAKPIEFREENPLSSFLKNAKRIPFWTDLVIMNHEY